MMRWLLLISVLFLTGCLGFSEDALKAMAASGRSYCYTASYGPAMVRAGGTGIQDGSMSCTNDGLTVTDTAAKIGVPLIVTPTISIGQPTIAPTK